MYPFPAGSPPGAQLPLGFPGDCTIIRSHTLRGRQTGILPVSVVGVSG